MIQLYWFIIPIFIVERDVKSMSNLNETISKLKAYVGEDSEEKVLMEKFEELSQIFWDMYNGFPKASKIEYSVANTDDLKAIKIEKNELKLYVNKQKNTIEVEKKSDIAVFKLDELILKDNELYSSVREVVFTEEMLNDYLKETFTEILG